MKISRQSWHYQLMERIGIVTIYDRSDLCSYIRGLIISMFVPITMILAPYTAYLLFYLTNVFIIYLPPVSFLMLLGLVIWMGIGLVFDSLLVLFISINCIDKYILSKIPKRETQYKEKKPNILIEYLKAKKKKICPLIEFEE